MSGNQDVLDMLVIFDRKLSSFEHRLQEVEINHSSQTPTSMKSPGRISNFSGPSSRIACPPGFGAINEPKRRGISAAGIAIINQHVDSASSAHAETKNQKLFCKQLEINTASPLFSYQKKSPPWMTQTKRSHRQDARLRDRDRQSAPDQSSWRKSVATVESTLSSLVASKSTSTLGGLTIEEDI